jgi:hypothetical protein
MSFPPEIPQWRQWVTATVGNAATNVLTKAVYNSAISLLTQHILFSFCRVVAVTGLPNPQANHAVIMAKFANECIIALSTMMHVLVDRLGDDTVSTSKNSACGMLV